MIEFSNPEHGERIAASAGVLFNPRYDVVVARTERGDLYGGTVFKDYTGVSVAGHMAGFNPRWINKDLLWVTFDYAFNQLKVATLFGPIKETNSKALELDLKLGFSPTARIKDVFPCGDMILLSMKRDQCRWLDMPRPKRFEERVLVGG